MIGHICVTGKKCIFYSKCIEPYEHLISFGGKEIRRKGIEINYYCSHPKKIRYFENKKLILKKPLKCKFKTTNQLGDFFKC